MTEISTDNTYDLALAMIDLCNLLSIRESETEKILGPNEQMFRRSCVIEGIAELSEIDLSDLH